MKMFLRSGKFKEELGSEKFDGLNSIDWTPSAVIEGETLLTDSIHEVTTILGRYDVFKFGTIKEREIYVIYKKINSIISKEFINKLLDDIKDNRVKEIVNYEDVMIYEALQRINYSQNNNYKFYIDDTVFWDVFNHFIIVIGKDNLRNLALSLGIEPYRKIAITRNRALKEYIEVNESHSFFQKVKNL